MGEINKNQYTCHSGYVGLPPLRSPVAPIAARILSSNAGERGGPRANAECGNLNHIFQGHFTGIETIKWLSQCQWSCLNECGHTGHMNPYEHVL